MAKWILVLGCAAVLLAGCKKEEPSEKTAPEPAAKTEQPAQPQPAKPEASSAPEASAATAKPALDKALLAPAKLTEKAPEKYQVKFVTTRGDFTLIVTRAWSPLGADRFYNLVKHHFYDNAGIFRVVPGFVVQFGISGTPSVSSAWKKTNIKDDPVKESNKRGTITFATSGPNTRTTQVFINLRDNARLDSMGFSPFGIVDGNGMNVVEMFYEGYGDNGPDQDKIESQGNSYLKQSWPKVDYIKSATLVGAK